MTDRLLALVALVLLAGLALAFGESQLRRQMLASGASRLTWPILALAAGMASAACLAA